jgi:DNA-binding Lrp family transcriptional regulator
MVQAYVLIEVDVGRARDVLRQIQGGDGITHCSVVTGPFDIIASVTAADVDALGQLVERRIRAVKGITRTITCPVFRI